MQESRNSSGSVQSGHDSTVISNTYKDNRSIAVQLLIVSMLLAIIVIGQFIVYELKTDRSNIRRIERILNEKEYLINVKCHTL